jgi:uncharacterized protein (DUF4415 family)
MRNISAKKLVRKSAAQLRPQNLADLRRNAHRPVDTSDLSAIALVGSGESHRIRKRSVTLRLDEDVVEFFRAQGAGYQTRINGVLRAAAYPPKTLREQLKFTADLLDQLSRQAK